MPVGVLLRSITSYELTEWMAYYNILDGRGPAKQKVKTSEVIKAMFANRVKKKEK